jgi:hypothetical protein
MENIMKNLLLLSLLSLISSSAFAMETPYSFTPKKNRQNPEQERYLRNIYFFAEAESEIHPIIAQELQKLNPDKWEARRQLNAVIKKYFRDLTQNEKNELMNAFSERWRHESDRMVAVPKR